MNKQKGFVYTIEVMLAIATILVVVVLMFSGAPKAAETDLAVIKQTGYDALFYMDQSDDLRSRVRTGDLTTIKSNLSGLLPSSVKFDANICNPNAACLSPVLPANTTIITVNYYVSGYREQYVNKKVRLWLWKTF